MRALRNLLSNPLRRTRAVESRSVAVSGDVDVAPARAAAGDAAALAREGRLEKSLAVIAEALERAPHDATRRYERGLTLLDWDRVHEALGDFLAAERDGYGGLGLHVNTAQAAHRVGMLQLAERHVRAALAIDENCATAHVGLGAIAQSVKNYPAAIESFERAYVLGPQAHIQCYLSTCKLDAGDARGAAEAARRAVGDEPELSQAWAALGMALSQQDRRAEAIDAFARAEALEQSRGEAPEAFVGHGFNLIGFGEVPSAIELYRRYLPQHPHANAQTHCGFSQLTLGNYAQGWDNYEFRWCGEPLGSARLVTSRPRWKGQDLKDRTLLLWTEQGLGDFIQFARFVSPLQRMGAKVIVQTRPHLVEFAREALDADTVVGHADEVTGAFDYHIPMMSVPGVLRFDPDDVPAEVPYLAVDPARAQTWRQRIGSDACPKVGLVWAGNQKHERDAFRSIPLRTLAPLLNVPGVSFVSLQKEQREGDHLAVPAGAHWFDAASYLNDFCDTAAAIEALDVVVAVDTAVAHLAGALGKPVWLLLPSAGDFRWLTERDDSPWYPTMRLFRQTVLGDWTDVVSRLAGALRAVVTAQSDAERLRLLLPPARQARPAHVQEQTNLPDETITRVTETRYGIIQYRPADSLAGNSLEWCGEWLHAQLEWLLQRLPRDAMVVEIAAGFGAHTLALANHTQAAGHVLAYEADSKLRRLLTQNLAANRLSAAVTVMRRNIGGCAAAAVRDAADNPAVHPVETLDELLLERLHLIKFNSIEQAGEIVGGATNALWRHRPLLMLNIEDDSRAVALLETVKAFGYRVWRWETPLFDAANHDRRTENPFGDRTSAVLLGLPEEQVRADIPVSAGEL